MHPGILWQIGVVTMIILMTRPPISAVTGSSNVQLFSTLHVSTKAKLAEHIDSVNNGVINHQEYIEDFEDNVTNSTTHKGAAIDSEELLTAGEDNDNAYNFNMSQNSRENENQHGSENESQHGSENEKEILLGSQKLLGTLDSETENR